MKEENPGVWFEIYVDNMDRAKKFYETVFKTSLTDMPMPDSVGGGTKMLAFPSTMENIGNGAAGALVKMDNMKAGGSGTIIYLGTEDCSVEEARVESAGGKVVQPKMNIGQYGFIVLATDTEGNTFGIHSMK